MVPMSSAHSRPVIPVHFPVSEVFLTLLWAPLTQNTSRANFRSLTPPQEAAPEPTFPTSAFCSQPGQAGDMGLAQSLLASVSFPVCASSMMQAARCRVAACCSSGAGGS